MAFENEISEERIGRGQKMSRLIFHIDVNSAFLSWESARRVKQGLSDLRDIPACIGGDPYRNCCGKVHTGKKIWDHDR